MHFRGFGHSDVGQKRQNNEDYFVVDDSIGLYLVCDGMGGHASGEVASQTAGEFVREHLLKHKAVLNGFDGSPESSDAVTTLMREAIQLASNRVWTMASETPGQRGMGTTCVCMVVLGEQAVLGHAGDSRLYLQRGGRLYQLTQDHNYANDAIKHGIMSPEDAWASPYAGMVTRAVGVQDHVMPDTLLFDLVVGDTFLLCSDGLYEYFEDDSELATALGGDVEPAPEQLVGLANVRGGKDNITAVVLRVEAEGAHAEVETKRKTVVEQRIGMLRHAELFTELSMAEVVRVMNVCEPVRFEPGQVILQMGEKSESLFVLVQGEVAVMKGDEPVAVLLAGQHFGEIALLEHRPRTATVIARTEVRGLELKRQAFEELMIKDSAVGAKVLYKLAQSLSQRLDDSTMARQRRRPNATIEMGSLSSPFRRASRGRGRQ